MRDHKVNHPPVNLIRGKFYTGKGTFIEPGFKLFDTFFLKVLEAIRGMQITQQEIPIEMHTGLKSLQKELRAGHKLGGRAIFVGNGGSAAIASHNAIDWTKNGGVRSIAFNDAAALTCWGNDVGYENVFAKQLEHHATKNDTVIIISSSGKSPNVLLAADSARVLRCRMVVTLSGMNPNNVLRQKGDLNIYVPSTDYGIVELAHMSILHSIVSVSP